ncbi:MAG TPA: LysM peptidoglycan-binding domain-containing protein [Gammaproteobacteria bacterium]|nr:LysM peptidoglycan-binding domain-containing protein [Gammaproteobacteria bacterium]
MSAALLRYRTSGVVVVAALLLAGCAAQHIASPAGPPAPGASQGHATPAAPSHTAGASAAKPGSSPAAGGSPGPRELPFPTAAVPALEMPWSGPAAPARGSGKPQTLWTDMRAGFTLDHHRQQPAVKHWIAVYRERQEILQEDFHRARPFLWRIVHDVRAHGLPAELALLPEVESAYNPFAHSDASQATGLWQFMPGTAERFGLRRDWWYDGRRDILRSTGAAVSYLQYLGRMFHGHWLLAIAAYNSGEGTVQDAIRRNARRGLPTDFWDLHLPRQTEQYVPQLLALAVVVNHPSRYGIRLPKVPDKPHLGVVKLSQQIDIALAAKLAGIPVHRLRELNPGLRRWATDPHGPHRLVLPRTSVARFKQRLAQIPSGKLVSWRRYVVHPGNTLSQIAQRYGTTPGVLERVNHLHGTLIRSGHTLLVPASATGSSRTRLALIREQYSPDPDPGDGGATRHYRVHRGDSLWTIAHRFGVSVASLRRWNGLSGDHTTIRPGQTLVVPRAQGRVACRVQKGDSLWSIAHRYGVSVKGLRRWNSLPKGADLQPGQHLTVRLAYRGEGKR